jgi:pimeloyl-ACP methyl ester carboxylesterase
VKTRVDDRDLGYEVFGEGRPLYVLHGGPHADSSYLREWLEPLREIAQIVLVDHVVGAHALEELDAVRRELGHDRIALFGHAVGGMLAQQYALEHPLVVDTLLLCCAPGLPDDSLRRIGAPTLVMGGRHDDVVGHQEFERVFHAIDDAELITFERSGQFPFASQPDVFFQLIRAWLDGQEERRSRSIVARPEGEPLWN